MLTNTLQRQIQITMIPRSLFLQHLVDVRLIMPAANSNLSPPVSSQRPPPLLNMFNSFLPVKSLSHSFSAVPSSFLHLQFSITSPLTFSFDSLLLCYPYLQSYPLTTLYPYISTCSLPLFIHLQTTPVHTFPTHLPIPLPRLLFPLPSYLYSQLMHP